MYFDFFVGACFFLQASARLLFTPSGVGGKLFFVAQCVL